MSQLQLVHSGYHTHTFQYADSSRVYVSVLHYSRKGIFQCGRLNESSNKANAYLSMWRTLALVLLFYVGKRRYRFQKPLQLQRYNKILEYTSLWSKKSNLFEFFCKKGLLLAQTCDCGFEVGRVACRCPRSY